MSFPIYHKVTCKSRKAFGSKTDKMLIITPTDIINYSLLDSMVQCLKNWLLDSGWHSNPGSDIH